MKSACHLPQPAARTRFPIAALAGVVALLGACASPPAREPAKTHLQAESVPPSSGAIPAPVQQTVALPRPKAAPRTETYSVVVNNVKVQELLFALARDARLNVDIHPGISGNVTLNAIDQTLPQILNRLAKQVDMRFELDGPNLAVMPDTPFLRNYKIDYVNMSRDTTGTVSVTTQIATAAAGVTATTGATAAGGAGATGSGGNSSVTRIENKAQHHFWETLIQNVKDILRETDKVLPEGSSETITEQSNSQNTSGTGAPAPSQGRGSNAAGSLVTSPNAATFQAAGATVVRRSTFREAASVMAHPETGIITVRATGRQHEKIQEFLDQVMSSAKRQVLIEATIAEVQLAQNYQQGINWSRITGGTGFSFTQTAGGGIAGLLAIGYTNPTSDGIFTSAIRLLETFGTVKVLSSPKISVLNNQTAVIKVVDNRVYFTIKADTSQNQVNSITTYTSTLNSVPVGFVMNVTPQVSDNDTVLLNIRPSISRVVSTIQDPNPALKKGINGLTEDIKSEIPVIRTREMESVLRVENGNIAVMGGLMEDVVRNTDDAVPGLSRLPAIGSLFARRDDTTEKTELVIFLRPIIIREASIHGDYAGLRDTLPNRDFFGNNPGPQQQLVPSGMGARP
ncbi:type II and III secretion system protein [Azospira sp. I13]|uniref:type II secretion system protein GspD n=1 Tax=Azospira sp. I13 TaxID=1765050 RepID=UPI000D4AED0D|nr:type II and III secretion system protein [Azospira sp. I13]GBG01130.1 type II and III secretion system protein [Azospira sp. I13]